MAKGDVESVIIPIGGDSTEFKKELWKLRAESGKLQTDLTRVAKVSAAGFTVLAGVVAASVVKFAAFEKTFSNVETLLDSSSFATTTLEKGIDGLRSGVLSLGAQSGESFDDLNKGLFDLISAGVPAEQAMSALGAATELSAAGATSVDIATKALVATITAYGNEAGSAREISEKFFIGQKKGVTTVGELSSEFNKVAGLARELGQGFDETLASGVALTANGAKPAAQAFTELRAVMNAVVDSQQRLPGQSAAVQSALSLQNVKSIGLVASLQKLKEATGGDVVALKQLLGSTEAVSAALSLTGAQSQLYSDIVNDMADANQRSATYQDAVNLKQETAEKAFNRLTQSVNAIVISLGERFAPVAIRVADSLAKMAENVSQMDNETIDNIANLALWGGGILAATTGLALMSKAILAARTVMAATRIAANLFWAAVTGPVGKVVAALSLVAGAVWGVSKAFGQSSKEIKTTEDNLAEEVEAIQTESVAAQQKIAIDHKKEKTKIAQASSKELEKIEEANAKRLLEINSNKLEIMSMEDEGATDDQIKRKQEALRLLTEIDQLENRNAEYRQKNHLTKTEQIMLAHNQKLININRSRLEKLQEQQEEFTDWSESNPTVISVKTSDVDDTSVKEYEPDPIEIPTSTGTPSGGGGATGGGGSDGGGSTGGGGTNGGTVAVIKGCTTGNRSIYSKGQNNCGEGFQPIYSSTTLKWYCVQRCCSGYEPDPGWHDKSLWIITRCRATSQSSSRSSSSYSGSTMGLSKGGYIRAQQGLMVPQIPGVMTDRYPALLEPGELVVPRDITSQMLQHIQSSVGGKGNQEFKIVLEFAQDAERYIHARIERGKALGVL